MCFVRKLFLDFVLTLAVSACFGGIAHAYTEHPPHNMLLFGTEEVFASQIVYKEPHNFQIILKINLAESAKEHYLFLRHSSPAGAQVVLLLDPMDISKIAEAESISGTIKIRNSSDTSLNARVSLKREEFEVVYINKLPLTLSAESHSHSGSDLARGIDSTAASNFQCAKDDQRPRCCQPINNCWD